LEKWQKSSRCFAVPRTLLAPFVKVGVLNFTFALSLVHSDTTLNSKQLVHVDKVIVKLKWLTTVYYSRPIAN